MAKHRDYLLLLLPLIFGLLSTWELWEQDLFLQIRTAQDLWQTHQFSIAESWSYSASGQPWFNFQWLNDLIIYSIQSVGDSPGLILSRGLLVFLLTFLLGQQFASHPFREKLIWSLLLLPLCYIAIFHRIQLRGELFVLVIFSFSLLPAKADNWKIQLLTGLLVANIHPGLLPFVVLWQFCRGYSQRFSKKWFCVCAAMTLCLFLTPYPLQVWSYLTEHLFYGSTRILGNPEHRGIGKAFFQLDSYGLIGYVWTILTAGTGIFLLAAYKKTRRREFIDGLVVFIFFTAMCIHRDRAIPFQVVGLFPYLVLSLREFSFEKRRLALFAALSVCLLAWQITLQGHKYKLRVSPEVFPIEEAELVNQFKLKGSIFHTPSYGSYLLTFAQNYKVFMDTRETPFLGIQNIFKDALESPAQMQKTLDDLKINIVIWPAPFPQLKEDLNFSDMINYYFPRTNWALCHFGVRSMLLVRRVAENNEIIRNHEYVVLSPTAPPHETLYKTGFQDETNRCLSNRFPHVSCLLAAEVLGLEFKKRVLYGSDLKYLNALQTFYLQTANVDGKRILDAIDKLN